MKRQGEAAEQIQRLLRTRLVRKQLFDDLAKSAQVPKIVHEIVMLLRLKAKDDSANSMKVREAILLKALPQLLGKINALLYLRDNNSE